MFMSDQSAVARKNLVLSSGAQEQVPGVPTITAMDLIQEHGKLNEHGTLSDGAHVSASAHHLRFTEGLLDFGFHICRTVFHENGTVRVALGHLFLALQTDTVHQAEALLLNE